MAKELSYIEKITAFISNMRVGQGEDKPTPASLTPFVDGQALKVGDKIKFNTSLDKSYIDNFLDNLDYPTEGNLCILLAPDSGEDILTAMDLTKVGFDTKFIISDADKMTIFYSTNTVTDPGSGMTIEAGWQPFVLENDGEIEMSLEGGNTTLEHLNDAEGWNGIIVGYVASEPGPEPPTPPEPGDLTPFESGGSLHAGDKLVVNLNASNSDIVNYLSTLTYDPQSYSCLLLDTTNEPGHSGQPFRIAALNFGTNYVLMGTDATGYPSSFWGYDTSTGEGGWQLKEFDGDNYYTIKIEGGVEYYSNIQLNDTAEGWNGVFIGVEKGE